MPETKVVNMRNEECDRRIDRATEFGNPFRLKKDGGKYTRRESIEAFRFYFSKRLDYDPEFREKVKELKGKKLGCWCKPKPCHGDVIKEYLEGESDA